MRAELLFQRQVQYDRALPAALPAGLTAPTTTAAAAAAAAPAAAPALAARVLLGEDLLPFGPERLAQTLDLRRRRVAFPNSQPADVLDRAGQPRVRKYGAVYESSLRVELAQDGQRATRLRVFQVFGQLLRQLGDRLVGGLRGEHEAVGSAYPRDRPWSPRATCRSPIRLLYFDNKPFR